MNQMIVIIHFNQLFQVEIKLVMMKKWMKMIMKDRLQLKKDMMMVVGKINHNKGIKVTGCKEILIIISQIHIQGETVINRIIDNHNNTNNNRQELLRNKVTQIMEITTIIIQEHKIKDRINISLRNKVMWKGKHLILLVNSSNQKITTIILETTINQGTIIIIIKEIITKGIHTITIITITTDSKVGTTILTKVLLETILEKSHSRIRKA